MISHHVIDPEAPALIGASMLAALLERLPRAAALADPQGRLLLTSEEFRHHLGPPSSSLPDLTLAELLDRDPDPLLRGSCESLEAHLLAPGRASPGLPLRISRLAGGDAREGSVFLLELLERSVSLAELESLLVRRCDQGAALFQFELLQLDLVRGRLGIAACDALVEDMAQRLGALLPGPPFLCRQAADRVLALVPGRWDPEGLHRIAADVLTELEQPMSVAEHVIQPCLSVGISRSPEDGTGFLSLLAASTRALDDTHRPPFASCCVAAPQERSLQLRERLAVPLASAIAQERLELVYQPILDLGLGRIHAVEVLCRWDDPVLGRQSPSDFINVAEDTEQIAPLGNWVLENACAHLSRWDSLGLGLDRIDINISSLQLQDPGWRENLLATVRRHGLDPTRIVLELTESSILKLPSLAVDQMRELRRLGFPLAMDDFGTGYSGLQRLSGLPLQEVKVDRSLIAAIDYDALQQAMFGALLNLSRSTGIAVVVEGIERSRQLQMLMTLGCRLGQGYHLCAPLSSTELEQLLRDPGALGLPS